jgi:uncharacterized protein YuzE
MKINYDKNADAVYIAFRKGSFVRNKKIDESTILDLDKSGNLLGIEILNASKRIPKQSLSELKVTNFQLVR